MAAGYDCIGIDVEDHGGYPGELRLMDVRELAKDPAKYLPGVKPDLIVASPPCQEFSYRSFPFKRARLLAATVPPDKSIWEACQAIGKFYGCPTVIENVRGAIKYMGQADCHYGSFYFWGDVPLLIPAGRPVKGFKRRNKNFSGNGSSFRGGGPSGANVTDRDGKKIKEMSRGASQYLSSGSLERKQWSAKIAMIPFEFAKWVGEYHKKLKEVSA